MGVLLITGTQQLPRLPRKPVPPHERLKERLAPRFEFPSFPRKGARAGAGFYSGLGQAHLSSPPLSYLLVIKSRCDRILLLDATIF